MKYVYSDHLINVLSNEHPWVKIFYEKLGMVEDALSRFKATLKVFDAIYYNEIDQINPSNKYLFIIINQNVTVIHKINLDSKFGFKETNIESLPNWPVQMELNENEPRKNIEYNNPDFTKGITVSGIKVDESGVIYFDEFDEDGDIPELKFEDEPEYKPIDDNDPINDEEDEPIDTEYGNDFDEYIHK
jgi:hypothetical protein